MPFDIDEANPSDTGVVSQYPQNERDSRSAIKSIVERSGYESDGTLKIDAGTTANRATAFPSPQADNYYWNTDKNVVEYYDGSSWLPRFGIHGPGDFKLTAYSPVSPPDGWLECNGQEVNRTTYADLFAAIGVLFGNGNGSTTFNVPDFRGNVPVGYHSPGGDGDGDYDAIGDTEGSKTHTLATGEQNSVASAGAHSHPTGSNNYAGGGTPAVSSVASDGAHTHPLTADAAAHENRQPSLVVGFLVKT